jgi:hypothetical protein
MRCVGKSRKGHCSFTDPIDINDEPKDVDMPSEGLTRAAGDLTREEVQAFLNAKLKIGLAWETVAHMKHALSKMLSAAVEWGYSTENVATMVKLPRR